MLERLLRSRFPKKETAPKRPVDSHTENIQLVLSDGITPLSMKNILAFGSLGQKAEKLVVFDSPLHSFGDGNHWKILEIDSERNLVTLQLCSPTGGMVYSNESPFQVHLDEAYFTGASITERTSDEIYWAAGFKDHLGLEETQCIPAG